MAKCGNITQARWADYTPTQCQWHEAHSPWPEGDVCGWVRVTILPETGRTHLTKEQKKPREHWKHECAAVPGTYSLGSMFLQTPPGWKQCRQCKHSAQFSCVSSMFPTPTALEAILRLVMNASLFLKQSCLREQSLEPAFFGANDRQKQSLKVKHVFSGSQDEDVLKIATRGSWHRY